jgi:protease I
LSGDYQDLEVWYPALRLREEGADVIFLGTDAKEYKGKFGYPLSVHDAVGNVKAANFDAVIVPGGWAPDFLRRYKAVLDFVRDMAALNRPVAAICHAGWVLASADILKGKTVTCFSAIKDDVVNAGARWVDQDVVVDMPLITARKPDDLPAFTAALIERLNSSCS